MLGILLNSRCPMFVFWGPELLQIYNDAYRPVPGAKHPWALGRPAQQIWSEVWADIGPLVARALNGDPTWAENLMLVVNRNEFPEEVYFTFSYSPIPDEEGIGGMFCACTETTAQVLAERRLRTLSELAVCATARSVGEACARSAEALERNAADVPFALIYLVTENGATSVAASAGLSAGGPLDEGRVAHELLTAFGDAPGGGAAVIHDLPARVSAIPPGPWSETPTSALLLPVVNPLGRTTALCVFGISSRRPLDADYRTWLELVSTQVGASIASAQAFEDQRKQAQALAELDRAKTTFFSNISHEFRTPLTLILGPLEDALSAAAGEEDRQRLMLMHRNALRLQKLVNTLLEFARIEAGRLSANLVATDLSELTLDLVSAFRAACDKAGLRLSIHCDPLRAPVAVDREMWEKIVLNLMSNALKYTFDGEIAVRVQDSDDAVVMSVTDTGIGIGVEHLPHLFERFHRAEGARARTHEGSGIGLALVHEFVRLNGGGIDVQSAPGRGTTFSVSVPRRPPVFDVGHTAATLARSAEVAAVVDQAMRWMEQPAGEPAGLAAPGSARILVVDDNSDMRAYLCRLLGGQYDVRAASDGEAALDEVRHHAPDLIVSDLMMPGLDGFGLLQRLRAGNENRGVPFLLLTAKADEGARVQALSLGVDDYLTKPFSARELRARVEALLRLAQMRREATDALRDAEARFRQMADDAPMMVWVTDENGVCTFLSKSWYEFTGQTAESGLAFGWVSAIHPDDRVKVRETFFSANRSRGPYRFEYRLQHAEGGYRWVLGAAAPRLDAGSEFRGYIGSVIDITERKETEDRRQHLLEAERQARVRAEGINAATDGFLATLSHELRAPLNTIVGWSELLVEKSLEPVEARDAVSIIARAAETQSAMIEDLLDMSRIVSGRVELTPEPVHLDAIVRQSVQAIRPAAETKGVRVVESIDAQQSLIQGDPQRLRQIVGNILVNAVKFTPAGGLVSIRLRRRDE
ncbi:MAG: response regulator, partial [Acidobacteria bacterium]|nr:response regulator [Acidobacteriota bacterium]